jgi:hypothetical protein
MFIDDKLVFSDAQAVTVDAASSNVIDTAVASSNLGAGSPLIIRFIVETAFGVASTDTTLTIILQDSATDFGGTHGLLTVPDLVRATSLVKGGYIPEIKIPDQHLRYLRLYYDVGGAANFNAGKITAWVDITT